MLRCEAWCYHASHNCLHYVPIPCNLSRLDTVILISWVPTWCESELHMVLHYVFTCPSGGTCIPT